MRSTFNQIKVSQGSVRLVNAMHLYICIKNVTIKNNSTRNHKVSRVLAFRVVVGCLTWGYQLSEEVLSSDLFIGNHM